MPILIQRKAIRALAIDDKAVNLPETDRRYCRTFQSEWTRFLCAVHPPINFSPE